MFETVLRSPRPKTGEQEEKRDKRRKDKRMGALTRKKKQFFFFSARLHTDEAFVKKGNADTRDPPQHLNKKELFAN